MSCKPLPAEDLDHVLAQTRSLWSEAKGCSFFITGGTGFFGMWLLESFTRINDELGLGMHATVLTRNATAFAAKAPHLSSRPDLYFVEGDIRSFAYPEQRFEYLIHAATEASARLNEDAPQEMLDVIVGGTRHLLGLAGKCSVKKLLLVSSGAVYGRQPPEITHVSEDYLGAPDPLLPGSAYGEGKRVSEHMCSVHAQRNNYELKVARCFAFVGPHLPLDAHFAIGNFIRDALAGHEIRVTGDGSPMRSYLYASDLAVWLWTILFRGSSGRAFNVGSDADVSIGELASLVPLALQKQKRKPVEFSTNRPAKNMAARYVPDIARARNELDLEVSVPLDLAIAQTAAWYQASMPQE